MSDKVEIERKYLLATLPSEAWQGELLVISQGWLPGKTIKERIRETIYPDGHAHYVRAIKVGSGLSRFEFEEDMSAALFNAAWPFTEGRRVSKHRLRYQQGGLLWEFDSFGDRTPPLYIAEVELATESWPVDTSWFQHLIIREVTGESEYSNERLAR